MKIKALCVAMSFAGLLSASESLLEINLGAASVHQCGSFSAYSISDTLYVTTFWDGPDVERFANKHFKLLFAKKIEKKKDILVALLSTFKKLDIKMCGKYSADSQYGKSGCDGIVVITDIKQQKVFCANVGNTRAYFFSPTRNGATATDQCVNNKFVAQHGGQIVGSRLFYKGHLADKPAGLGYAFFKKSVSKDIEGNRMRGPVDGVPKVCCFDLNEQWAYIIIGSYWFNHLFFTNGGVGQFFKNCVSRQEDRINKTRECLYDAMTMTRAQLYKCYACNSFLAQALHENELEITDRVTWIANRLANIGSYGVISEEAEQKAKSGDRFDYPAMVCVLQLKNLARGSQKISLPESVFF